MTVERVAQLAAKITEKRLKKAETVAGIVWVREHSGRRYAMVPSGTDSGHYYRVDGFGCRCVGFQNHHYCKHSDAVLLRLVKRAGANPAPEYTTARAEDGTLEILADGWVVGVVAPADEPRPDDEPSAEFERWLAEMDAEQAMRDLYGDAA